MSKLLLNGNMKRCVILLAAVLVIGAQAVGAQTWNCGAATNPGGAASVTATLSDGTLTVSGEGAMGDFYYSIMGTNTTLPPWNTSRNLIVNVIIEDGVTHVGNVAFGSNHNSTPLVYAYPNLTSVIIPNSVTSIGNYAFYACPNLTSVTIPNSVTSIGLWAFAGCSGLTSVTIPSSLTSIGNSAFANCTGLTSITISDGATSIAPSMFGGCTGLTTVTIPSSVTSISTNAFYGCSRLATIISLNPTPPAVTSSSFANVPINATLYVPQASIAAYNGWGGFYNIKSAYPSVTFNSQSGSAVTNQTVLVGSKAEEPIAPTRAGHTFGGWYKDNVWFDEAWDFASDVVMENITLYAKWDIVTYTVSWNSDGGTPAPAQRTVDHGDDISEPAAMTKTGYTFGGWYKNAEFTGAEAWDFDTDVVTANITLYAKWTLNTYTVKWNADGGTPVLPQTSVSHGSEISQPAVITKTGYTFGGWYSNEALTSAVTFPITNVTANMELYAKWSIIAVTDIIGNVPNAILVGTQFTLTGTVVPADAKNSTIVWSIANAGTTGAGIYGNVFMAASIGEGVVIKAAIADGKGVGVDYEKFFFVTVSSTISVLSPERVIPPLSDSSAQNSGITSGNVMSGEFTAGPNPAAKSAGVVNFFWQGKKIQSASLTIFDASGNVVRKISTKDNKDAKDDTARRIVGSWDLTDAKGRQVSEGTYLARGTVTTADGKKERVSVMIGVRD